MANECLSASLCGELALGWTSLTWLSPIPFPFCSPRALYCLGDTLWTRGDSSCSEQSCGSTLWASISSGLEAFLASFAPKLCLYQPWKARLSLQSEFLPQLGRYSRCSPRLFQERMQATCSAALISAGSSWQLSLRVGTPPPLPSVRRHLNFPPLLEVAAMRSLSGSQRAGGSWHPGGSRVSGLRHKRCDFPLCCKMSLRRS